MKLQRALLLTSRLAWWAGSEIVLLELAEELVLRGAEVRIFSHDITPEFVREVRRIGATCTRDPAHIAVEDYDLVYCQHQVLSSFAPKLVALDPAERPLIVYAHLSPYEPLEYPGPAIEPHLADAIMCNSEETADRMEDLGLPRERIYVFPNPAPRQFFGDTEPSETLRSLLAVSNHFPQELRDALEVLESEGVHVTLRGLEYENKRVLPKDLAQHDAVITIGKTVQYALAARRPAYVYDRFGGPGWVSPQNVAIASRYNFSGRCSKTKKSARTIASELREAYGAAVGHIQDLDQFRDGLRLESHVDKLISFAQRSRDSLVAGTQTRFLDDRASELRATMQREHYAYVVSVNLKQIGAVGPKLDSRFTEFFARHWFAWMFLRITAKLGSSRDRAVWKSTYQSVKNLRRQRR